MAQASDPTNAERQRRYRERKRQERRQLEQAGGVTLPADSTARVRKNRVRKRTAAQVAEVAAQTGSDVDPKEAAAQLLDSDGETLRYTRQDLRDALEVGRCCRILEEMIGGYTAQEDELADWLASNPPLGWLFFSWVLSSPWAREFSEWWAERSVDATG